MPPLHKKRKPNQKFKNLLEKSQKFKINSNYPWSLNFLTRLIPTPGTASNSSSFAEIICLVVLNPASYNALALFAPIPGKDLKLSKIFFESCFLDLEDFVVLAFFVTFVTFFVFGFSVVVFLPRNDFNLLRIFEKTVQPR